MAGQLPEGEAAERRAGVAASLGARQTGLRPRGQSWCLASVYISISHNTFRNIFQEQPGVFSPLKLELTDFQFKHLALGLASQKVKSFLRA